MPTRRICGNSAVRNGGTGRPTANPAHLRKQRHVADGSLAGEQHHEAIYADAEAADGGHSVLYGGEEVLVGRSSR